MKNIILLDPSLYFIDTLLELEDIFIAVLIADDKAQSELLYKKYPNRIGHIVYKNLSTYDEFLELYKSDYNIKKKDIDLYRYPQLQVEYFSQREVLDTNEAGYRYLIGLTYFLGVFQEYRIDAFITATVNHGGIWDAIPIEIAKQKGIPVFIHEIESRNLEYASFYFRCANDNTILELPLISDKYVAPKLEDYTYKITPALYLEPKERAQEENEKTHTKNDLERIEFQTEAREVSIYTKFFKKPFYENTNIYDFPGNTSADEVVCNMEYIEALQETYDKISVYPKENEKYIFYALHREPEASIMNRDTFTNQLYIIKLLSESLPEGWKLYVKEHPNQFYYKNEFYYLIRNIFLFRTEQFYRNILDNKNVRLINIDEPSSSIIYNSQAVASICGSVFFEGVANNKPILIFGTSSSIFTEATDSFNIYSKNDIKNAVKAISNGFIPKYADIKQVIKKYLYECNYLDSISGRANKDFLKDVFRHMLYAE